jgi:hypothetical protein
MAVLRVHLDEETFSALMTDASNHLRPTHWHAEALIRQALGLPMPYPPEPVPTMTPALSAAEVTDGGGPGRNRT